MRTGALCKRTALLGTLLLVGVTGCSTIGPGHPVADDPSPPSRLEVSAGPYLGSPAPERTRTHWDDKAIRKVLAEQARTRWPQWVAEQRHKGLECTPHPETGFTASCTGAATIASALPFDKDPALSQRRAADFKAFVARHGSPAQQRAVGHVFAVVGSWENPADGNTAHLTVATDLTKYANDADTLRQAEDLVDACRAWQSGSTGIVLVSNVVGTMLTYRDTRVPVRTPVPTLTP